MVLHKKKYWAALLAVFFALNEVKTNRGGIIVWNIMLKLRKRD